ncbi:methyltransferase domain-containing protein [Altererythrobacter sp. CC-YST694]|uniref:methyltransferase domain-containing protein n=1 Tax=Altererythrobacter sp. CC-YST694 TaxID=2755038 RepID=UPI001D00E830|nr:methyltransferase domain-containing protein [Altererythrobacter sp. CC-YST694]MCB5424452.1 methyltransferase domain-containing protein [Altererythrobacter sp. CC-YST694]
MSSAPPTIFAPHRRLALRRRMRSLQQRVGAARYLMDDMVEDVVERIGFLRHEPQSVLVIGDYTGDLARQLGTTGCAVTSVSPEQGFDEEAPFPAGGFGLIASLGTLDTVNDLPGALIHIREALAPGGLMIASFMGAGSLPRLRAAMLAADGDRPAARMHPMVDVRAGGQLLQRCGFARPVVDSRGLDVRFGSFGSLLADLRAQGLGKALASPAPRLTRAAMRRAQEAFMGGEDRATEHFEILTLSGWGL